MLSSQVVCGFCIKPAFEEIGNVEQSSSVWLLGFLKKHCGFSEK